MKKYYPLLLFSLLYSCGPELDAKEVCKCYDEVYHTAEPEAATKKMEECLELYNGFLKKHKENNTYEEFSEEYDKCR